MLKDRTFLVKTVKDRDLDPNTRDEPIDYNQLAETATKCVVAVIAAWMGGDTLRQVLVHIAKTGIQAE